MRKKLSSFIAISLLIACSTVPITGRKRLNFVSDSQILPTSFAQYDAFLRENKLSTDGAKTAQIKTVGAKISKAVDKFMRQNGMAEEANNYRWEFNLVQDDQLNAWCMPGGKVVFYTGILPVAKNVDGIAAIMGHEVAHAFAKHGQERMSSAQLQQYGGAAVAIATSGQDETSQQLWNMAYGVGSQLGMLKYSRTHETEADKLGLVFMIMAGYNGEEAVRVWERMKALGGASQPEFLSTHPSNDSRIQTLRSYLPQARREALKYK
ncbi:M48 family metallopeptidase [Ochrovirga pacifica]|uniref:M48 family metallopeptidase n=1 Tax=Ochrovirga pacifica TaxID=1042376 RepID=UPI0002558EC2|nr:M48 family metallopeptidase [Ochrovirga pacifica]